MAKCIWNQYGWLRDQECEYGFRCHECPIYQQISDSGDREQSDKAIILDQQNVRIKPGELSISDQIPTDRRYCHNHLWIQEDGDEIHVGLTPFILDLLPEIQSLMLPETGAECKAGHCFTWMGVPGQTLFLLSPITGRVNWFNRRLTRESIWLRGHCYDRNARLVSLENAVTDHSCDLDAEAYAEHLKNCLDQLKSGVREEILRSHNIAADGGELVPDQVYSLPTSRWYQIVQPFMMTR